ncbi:MAG TPA: hypothetical protein VLA66_11315, partial [Thermoanaerobaculia bacterium]|nr:hypothetical protein [Thermoanaerobaculia bacterium]
MKIASFVVLAALCSVAPSSRAAAESDSGAVIDMHLHTQPWAAAGAGIESEDYAESWATIEQQLDRGHVELALVSGSQEIAERWRQLAPTRVVVGAVFPCANGALPNSGGRRCFVDGAEFPDLGWLRAEIEAGRIGFLGEITS